MSLHPGEKGVCSLHGEYDEFCGKCAAGQFGGADKAAADEKLLIDYYATKAVEPNIAEETAELVEEMAVTTVIKQLTDEYILKVSGWFNDLNEIAEEANPVKTYKTVVWTGEDVVKEAYELRRKLIELLAKKGDEIVVKGGSLTKQIVDSEEN